MGTRGQGETHACVRDRHQALDAQPWTLDSGPAASPRLDIDPKKLPCPLPALLRGPIYHHAMKQVTSETAFICPFARADIRSYAETCYSRNWGNLLCSWIYQLNLGCMRWMGGQGVGLGLRIQVMNCELTRINVNSVDSLAIVPRTHGDEAK